MGLSTEMRAKVYEALKKKTNIESVRIYHGEKTSSTMVHIVVK